MPAVPAGRPAETRSGEVRTVERVLDVLDQFAPRSFWRVFLAFASGLMTFVATTGGLFVTARWAQSAFVAGLAVGLAAPSLSTWALTGATVATLAGLIGRRSSRARALLLSIAVLLLVGDVWFTTPRIMLAGLRFGTEHLRHGGLPAFALVALGLLGAAGIPEMRQRVFAPTATVINYWGIAVVPLLYALPPNAFILIPDAAVGGRYEVGNPA